MNFSSGMIAKAKKAASAEEILAMAREEGIALSATEAAEYYDLLHGSRPLEDEELDCVAGGKGGDDSSSNPPPKYHVGQILDVKASVSDTGSPVRVKVLSVGELSEFNGYGYYLQNVEKGYTYGPFSLEKCYVVVVG